MSLRLAIGGIEHETNTYATATFGPTSIGAFQQARGDRLLRMRGRRTYIGGMLDAADDAGHEVIPTLFAIATPSGTIAADAYKALKTELLERISDALPVDAVALDLHGAGVVDGIEDLESDLAAAVRLVVGPDVRIVATLDLHGNITAEMAESIDLMLGVHEYPHVDCYERGREVIEALPRLLAGEWRPVTHVERLPLLLAASTTDLSPASDVRDRCFEAERIPGVIDCTFFHGFAYTDIAAVGASVVVTTNGDTELARRVAGDVAGFVWDGRESFRPEIASTDVALLQARRIAPTATRAIVINDTSDNPGGGAPGDATHLLRAMLAANLDLACFGYIYDPEVAAAAHRVGVGATIEVHLGGKHDSLHGEPIELRAYVKTLSDGSFHYTSPMLAGVRARLGPMARLQADGPGGLDILVSTERGQTFDDEVFLLHGIDVRRYKFVGLKGSQHFRAGFSSIAAAMIAADAPGLTTSHVEAFEHSRADGPRWPIDPTTEWHPTI